MREVEERAGGEEGRGPVDPLWDDWDVPPLVPSSPELHLEGFDGPLDLLLDLAERQRIDLGRISVLQLAEQFVAAMARLARQVPLERRGDWLVMASRLVLLRSRLCFPASPEAKTDAEKEARREIARLDQIRVTRAAAAWLEARVQVGRDVFVRLRGPDARTSSYMDLMEACLANMLAEEARLADADTRLNDRLRIVPTTLYPVADVIRAMRERLRGLEHPEPLERFVPPIAPNASNAALAARCATSATLIAALELARSGEAIVMQPHSDLPVLIEAAGAEQMLC